MCFAWHFFLLHIYHFSLCEMDIKKKEEKLYFKKSVCIFRQRNTPSYNISWNPNIKLYHTTLSIGNKLLQDSHKHSWYLFKWKNIFCHKNNFKTITLWSWEILYTVEMIVVPSLSFMLPNKSHFHIHSVYYTHTHNMLPRDDIMSYNIVYGFSLAFTMDFS